MSTAPRIEQQPKSSDAAELIREIELYLRAVDEFRRQGRAPTWQAER
jgi:hypothetical protein